MSAAGEVLYLECNTGMGRCVLLICMMSGAADRPVEMVGRAWPFGDARWNVMRSDKLDVFDQFAHVARTAMVRLICLWNREHALHQNIRSLVINGARRLLCNSLSCVRTRWFRS